MNEVLDVPASEVVVHEGAALVPSRQASSLIALAGTADDIVAAQAAYQDICRRLLDESDIQVIGKKEFKKKSAWRKLGVAFGVSTQILSTTHERNERGRIIRTEVVARATAPNGRFAEGIGACDLYERCCDPETCRTPLTWPDGNFRHAHCEAWPCKVAHFSNPQHDIPATAATRATNRAAADLFGMGEVSAEEMTDTGAEPWHQDASPANPNRGSNIHQAHSSAPKPISPKQLPLVSRLLSAADLDVFDMFQQKIIAREVVTVPDLTSAEASRIIDHLNGKSNAPVRRTANEEAPYEADEEPF